MLSVIIPCYQSETTIEEAVLSVLDISKVKEVICVINGLKDKTGDILQNLKKSKKNGLKILIRYVEEPGVSNARNIGIELASQEYLFFLDADDFVEPKSFTRLLDFVDQKVISDFIFFGYTNKIEDLGTGTFKSIYLKETNEFVQLLSSRSLIFSTTSRLVNRKLIVEKSIRYPVNMIAAEDSYFFQQFALNAIGFTYIDLCTYFYRPNPTSASRGNYNNIVYNDKRLEGFEWVSDHLIKDKKVSFINVLYFKGMMEFASRNYKLSKKQTYLILMVRHLFKRYYINPIKKFWHFWRFFKKNVL